MARFAQELCLEDSADLGVLQVNLAEYLYETFKQSDDAIDLLSTARNSVKSDALKMRATVLLARFQHDKDMDAKQTALAELADALECLVPQMDDHFYEVEAHNTAACWNIYLGRYDEGRLEDMMKGERVEAKSILDRHPHLRLSLLEASFQEAASVVEMASTTPATQNEGGCHQVSRARTAFFATVFGSLVASASATMPARVARSARPCCRTSSDSALSHQTIHLFWQREFRNSINNWLLPTPASPDVAAKQSKPGSVSRDASSSIKSCAQQSVCCGGGRSTAEQTNAWMICSEALGVEGCKFVLELLPSQMQKFQRSR